MLWAETAAKVLPAHWYTCQEAAVIGCSGILASRNAAVRSARNSALCMPIGLSLSAGGLECWVEDSWVECLLLMRAA